ncbi:MAG: alpha-1,2-fucosyltransferase [Gemmatimonadaceae bacterium]|nr:alpha-1,2-fucosyltransferase [Gemmatimonadaceae bacterium]
MSSRPVYTLLMGGLGNQMFQYAVARAVAIRADGEVRLDTSLLDAMHPDLTPRTFGLGGFEVSATIATRTQAENFTTRAGVRGLVRRVGDRIRPLHLRRVIYEQDPAFDPHLLRARPPVYLSGFWQSEKYFTDVAHTIRSDFRLRQALSPPAEQYLAEIRSCDSVSVHVRRGDYAHTKALAVHGLLPSTYYGDAFNRLSQTGKDLTAFVFSDEIEWAKENIKLGAHTRFVDLGSGSEHAEIFLMAACNHHVISNSTFGWWGAWIGEREGTRIVAPRLWLADASKKMDIIPERWMRA